MTTITKKKHDNNIVMIKQKKYIYIIIDFI